MTLRTTIIGVVALVGVTTLAGCAMHRERALTATLSEKFHIGNTFYFESKLRCTAAVFRATENAPRNLDELATDIPTAQAMFAETGRVSLRMNGETPHQLTEIMLAAKNPGFGRKALAAAAQTAPCLTDSISREFRTALTRPSAVLAYDVVLNGVIVIDPLERKLFFAAGDPI